MRNAAIFASAFAYWVLIVWLFIRTGEDLEGTVYKASFLLFLTPLGFLYCTYISIQEQCIVKRLSVSIITALTISVMGMAIMDILAEPLTMLLGGS